MSNHESLRERARRAAEDTEEAESRQPHAQLEMLCRDILETTVEAHGPFVMVDGIQFSVSLDGSCLVGRIPCPHPGCETYREELVRKLADVAKLTTGDGRCSRHRRLPGEE